MNVPIPFMSGLSLFRFSNSTISTFSRNSNTDVKNALVPQNLKNLDPRINLFTEPAADLHCNQRINTKNVHGLGRINVRFGHAHQFRQLFRQSFCDYFCRFFRSHREEGASKRARSTFKRCPVVIQVSCPLSLMFGCTLLARPSSTYFTVLSVALMMSESNIVKALSRDFSPCRFPFD